MTSKQQQQQRQQMRKESSPPRRKQKQHQQEECSTSTALLVLLLFATLSAVFYVVHYTQNYLPTVQPLDQVPAHQFSEERAKQHTAHLVDKIGMRVVGSKQCDQDTVNYLLDAINRIEPVEGGPIIEVSVQKTSGSAHYEWLHTPLTHIFSNVINVVVRVRSSSNNDNDDDNSNNDKYRTVPDPAIYRDPQHYRHYIEYIETNGTHGVKPRSDINVGYKEKHFGDNSNRRKDALLISSHYDSAMGALGASDDGVPVGTMLEMIRVLASNKALKTPVVFNFNGGEEPGMQAAFGFLQHPWVETIRAVINLESCGSGGRNLLFQLGPANSWLIDAYAKSVPYPAGMIAAQDLFQKTHAVPGDTDFVIYREMGDIPGFDFAFMTNGYVYHTRYDDMHQVNKSVGSIQALGENVLALVRELSDNYLAQPEKMLAIDPKEEHVYFDILGKFMVVYPFSFAAKLYYTHAAVVLGGILWQASATSSVSFSSYLLAVVYACMGLAASLISGAISAALLSLVMVFAFNARMFWYTTPATGIALYSLAALVGALAVQRWLRIRISRKLLNNSSSANELYAQVTFWAVQLTLSFIACLFIYFDFGTGYLFHTTTALAVGYRFLLAPLLRPLLRVVLGGGRQLARYISDLIVPVALTTTLSMATCYRIYIFFVPIMGRSGTVVESEPGFAILSSLLVLSLVLYSDVLPALHSFVDARIVAGKRGDDDGLAKLIRFFVVATVVLALSVVSSIALYDDNDTNSSSGDHNHHHHHYHHGYKEKALRYPYTPDTPKRLFIQHTHHLSTGGTAAAAAANNNNNNNGSFSANYGDYDDTGIVEQSYLSILRADSVPVPREWFANYSKVLDAPVEGIKRDFETYYPFGDFISAGTILLERFSYTRDAKNDSIIVSHVQPMITLLKDELTTTITTTNNNINDDGAASITVRRRMEFRMHPGRDASYSNMRVPASQISAWSLTSRVPSKEQQSPPGYFMVRKSGAGGFTFWIELEERISKNGSSNNSNNNNNNNSGDERWHDITKAIQEDNKQAIKEKAFGPWFSIVLSSSCWYERADFFDSLESLMPAWTTPTMFQAFIREFRF